MTDSTYNAIHELIARTLADEKVDVIDVAVKNGRGGITIDVRADLPEGGISLDHCAALNRKLMTRFEEESRLADSVELTVSSPGLDWPLSTEKDFYRNRGRAVDIRLKEPMEGFSQLQGEITGCDAEGVALKVHPPPRSKKKIPAVLSPPQLKVAYTNIKKALQII